MMSVCVFMCAGENVTMQGVTTDLCPLAFFPQNLQLLKIYRFISINCVKYIDSGERLHLCYSKRKIFMKVCGIIQQGK